MAKVSYQGETIEIDIGSLPLHEGIAIQKKTGFRAMDLDAGLKAGDFIAMAAYAWVLLHFRLGKDVSYEDIESGTYPVDFRDFEFQVDEEPDPTSAEEAANPTS